MEKIDLTNAKYSKVGSVHREILYAMIRMNIVAIIAKIGRARVDRRKDNTNYPVFLQWDQ